MKVIKVFKEIGNYVVTRDSVKELFRKVTDLVEDEIYFDFGNVQFISRSCADEYLKHKEISKKDIKEVNVLADVKEMLRVVRSSRKNG